MASQKSVETSTLRAVFAPLVLVSSAGINLLSLALPFVLLQVYDRIIPNQSLETLSVLMLGLFTAIILETGLRYCRHLINSWRAAKFEHVANVEGFARIMFSENTAFQQTAVGMHLERMVSVEKMREFLSDESIAFVADLPFLVIFLVLLYILNPVLVLVPLTIIVLAAISALTVGSRLKGALTERSEYDDKRYNFLIETLAGVQTIKAFGIEHLLERRYERLMQESAVTSQRFSFYSNVAQSIASIFSEITTVAVACVGSIFVIQGQMSVGSLAACVLLSGRIVQPCMRSLGYWSRYQSFTLAQKRFGEIRELSQECRTEREFKGRIEHMQMKGVSLNQDGGGYILDDVDLEIGRGEVIALTGANGSGKSALINILRGAVQPSKGEVYINGEPLNSFDIGSVRKKVAYLAQHARLMTGSVVENMCAFDVPGNMHQALNLAKQTGLDKLIASLPGGLDTEVDPMNEHILSLGTIQHIALVRSLLGSPSLILFDEANSAVDHGTDTQLKMLLERYKSFGMSMVIVSHRPSLLLLADKHYVIDDGRLVAAEHPDLSNGAPGKSSQSSETLESPAGHPSLDLSQVAS